MKKSFCRGKFRKSYPGASQRLPRQSGERHCPIFTLTDTPSPHGTEMIPWGLASMVCHYFSERKITGFLYPAAFLLSMSVIHAIKGSGILRHCKGHTCTHRRQLLHRSPLHFSGSTGEIAPVGHCPTQIPHPTQVSLAEGWKGVGGCCA